MKKIFKSILAILLLTSLVFAVTGCNKKNNSNNNEAGVEDGKSKTYNALKKVFSGNEYTISFEQKDGSKVKLATKGDNIFMDATEEGEHLSIIQKDGKTYVISHDEKMYMVSEGEEGEMLDKNEFEIISKDDLAKIENSQYKTGKETIDGKEYEYEEYVNSDSLTERYYFEGKDLKYIKTIDEDGEEEIMKIVEMSSTVNDSVFEIPADYEKVDI